MSEQDETLEAIRRKKREELQQTTSGEQSATEPADAPSEPIHIEGPDHFQEFTSKYDVVLADFYADWCGPCKMLEPIVEELAVETDAAMAKVDVDANQALAQQYQVQGVPTMVLFGQGEVAERIVGVRDKEDLQRLIERVQR
ncbi:thioredoxin [Halanaeroarchaeum sulfurireducens]|uniref:Thioredoxin domain protein n=1 Tax=Halanaeroarchaeum sulfurireducens TaxID=1604004 RepID=A0A0F7PDN1_9EURY|nr:thioredoxin [Halanaeroarchaeum sulfurireducens]AKH97749.1 thioredoxin domain protein [Halanaeroarchaeum sulfurireducens]ALG82144.1 thioredoxin domain protein [Halanaeroarchaeum sulfurireducens]